MKPQATSFLSAADRAIANRHTVLTVNIPDQAARLAYYAQFYAAQALIFERTGKIAKTHKGVAAQFHLLATAETLLTPSLAAELSAAYYFKDAADYNASAALAITPDQARDAIAVAERFVDVVRQALASPPAA